MSGMWKRAAAAAVIGLTTTLQAADPPMATIQEVKPAPTSLEAKPVAAGSSMLEAWDPCAPVCPPPCIEVCPPPKLVCKESAPRKIIVHQADPIVEFRRDPSARPVHVDSNIRPVGDCFPCKGGHGAQGHPCRVKNIFHGCAPPCGCAPHQKHHAPQQSYQMVPTTVQMQAYVPQLVTYAAPATFAAAYAAPAYAPTMGYAAWPATYGYATAPTVGYDAAAFRNLLAAIDERPPASNGAAAAQAVQAAQAAQSQVAAFDARLKTLETRVQSIESRLGSIERGIDALCLERAKARE